MTATNKTLADLHEGIAQELLSRVRSGEATAAELSVATKFLKDNGIEAVAAQDSPLANLAASLPMFDASTDDEETHIEH
jgi:hypothetical protein|tara:strand:- start:3825 stop:4061 length:237 start_codon:yes stop_codon:yes gene_type:complete